MKWCFIFVLLEAKKVLGLRIFRDLLDCSSFLDSKTSLEDNGAIGDGNEKSGQPDRGAGRGLGLRDFNFFQCNKLGYCYPTMSAPKSAVKWQRELLEFKLFGVVFVHGVLE